MVYYGYYSEKQSISNSTIYIYLNAAGEKIKVTEITTIKKDAVELTKNFTDNTYMREVIKYDSKIHINKTFN